MAMHQLKIKPKYLEDVVNGRKTFELRKNDRDFKVGDTLILQEYDREYTGRFAKVTVTYLLKGGIYGLDKDYVILGIK